jgi:hypothetical protein
VTALKDDDGKACNIVYFLPQLLSHIFSCICEDGLPVSVTAAGKPHFLKSAHINVSRRTCYSGGVDILCSSK